MLTPILIIVAIIVVALLALFADFVHYLLSPQRWPKVEGAPKPVVEEKAPLPAFKPAELVLDTRPPADPDDIQISGDIPLVGSEDIHQSKTQPIPMIVPGGGEKIIVSDHVLFSFYQKLADPKSYDIRRLIGDKIQFRYGIGSQRIGDVSGVIEAARFEPYIPYDTMTIPNKTTEACLFMVPCGQGGKTQAQTNLQCGGVLVFQPHLFIFKTFVLRFMGDSPREDRNRVLEQGVLRMVDGGYRNVLETSLAMFAPLNPFDPDPKAFFLLGSEILIGGYDYDRWDMVFPRGLQGLSKEVTVRIELPGIRTTNSVLAMHCH